VGAGAEVHGARTWPSRRSSGVAFLSAKPWVCETLARRQQCSWLTQRVTTGTAWVDPPYRTVNCGGGAGAPPVREGESAAVPAATLER
jgi:hypothetical protein